MTEKGMHMKRILLVTASLALILATALFVSQSANAARPGAAGALILGPSHMAGQNVYQGFYDGHKDAFLLTDTSSKTQAKAWHINFSSLLAMIHGQPAQYFVRGRAAAGQLSVFGSEPGESDYSPLWAEIVVQWKGSSKPVLLVRDDQIKSLAKKGKLTMKANGIILNAPITKVGK